MSNKINSVDDTIDELDVIESEDLEDIGFISTPETPRRAVRKNIEDMLEARALQQSIREVFDDDF